MHTYEHAHIIYIYIIYLYMYIIYILLIYFIYCTHTHTSYTHQKLGFTFGMIKIPPKRHPFLGQLFPHSFLTVRRRTIIRTCMDLMTSPTIMICLRGVPKLQQAKCWCSKATCLCSAFLHFPLYALLFLSETWAFPSKCT